jgi:hypothetical protein
MFFPMAASHDLTDISAGYFETAKTTFAAWDKLLQFRRLGIEQNLAEKGFEPVV